MITFVKAILKKKIKNKKQLAVLKRDWAKDHKVFLPKNSDLIKVYKNLLLKKIIKKDKNFEEILRLKKVRSLSGIVPVAVLTKPYPCPGKCIYCPTQKAMPKSYLKDEPAVMRAKTVNFDPYRQVKLRIKQLQDTGHSTEKIELIVMGGTFSVLPLSYQKMFIKRCFDAANNKISKKLVTAQKINEKACNRIIGLTLETRPDEINPKVCKQFRLLGCTRVEIGVQSIYDKVLKKVKRGHSVRETINATQLLKDFGFKVCYHLMPNLPGSNPSLDLKMFKNIFQNPDFKPDMIKIYPCVVTYQAKLYDWYKKNKFKPYSTKRLLSLLIEIKKIIPPWIRINRLGRDIPVANIVAGNKISNIRQVLQKKLKEKNIRCQCIRCREIKNISLINQSIKFNKLNYIASNGKEYFLSFIDDNNLLYSMLRLRIPGKSANYEKEMPKVLKNSGLVRELHTYGLSLPINSKNEIASQHKGLGKKLLKKAEAITKRKGLKKICVISGIGAREYYQNLGYKSEETYMVKYL